MTLADFAASMRQKRFFRLPDSSVMAMHIGIADFRAFAAAPFDPTGGASWLVQSFSVVIQFYYFS